MQNLYLSADRERVRDMSADTKEAILSFAERQMRKGGYDAVSFRDIASAVGIKSASVHYHFPTKADLGQAVTRRYRDHFIANLGSPDEASNGSKDRILHLADAYLGAFEADHATCLCAVLGSVVSHLPSETSSEVYAFYDRLLDWIETGLPTDNTYLTPETVISILQGAMVLSIARNTSKPLEDARRLLGKIA